MTIQMIEPTNGGSRRGGVAPITLAAWSSLGAGALHAAAVGVHAEHRQAALAFAAVAAAQLAWGAFALVARPTRRVVAVGTIGSAGLVAAWLLAKAQGIWFIEGLDVAESVQTADTVAASLALVVTAIGTAILIRRVDAAFPVGRFATALGVALVVGLTGPGLVSASVHEHDPGNHASPSTGLIGDVGDLQGDDHGHAESPSAPEADRAAPHGEHAAAVAPVPYDPSLPIDLGGVEGVTPQQQAAAENLIAITLNRLPKYADPAAAEADGFRSIRDAATGHEHYINWSYIDDGEVLNPDRPESLVYEMRNGRKTLVSAMFMLGTGTTLDDVPELGGPLTQWHIHDNLCFSPDTDAPVVAGLTNADGSCTAPLVKFAAVPMIHVWIVSHPCGPFAALEGVGAGQIAEGEERLCDLAHGA